MNNTTLKFPQYKCHKAVGALQIKKIDFDIDASIIQGRMSDYSAIITVVRPDHPSSLVIRVDKDFIDKHNPHVDGYLVQYNDQYLSFSPKKAFEEGYTQTDTNTFNKLFDVNKDAIVDQKGQGNETEPVVLESPNIGDVYDEDED